MSIFFENWSEFERYLDGRGLFRMNPGTRQVSAVLDSMRLRRASMPLVQIAGTNGKGSTCAFIAALARRHGVSCAVHSSPHFVSVRERLRVFCPDGPEEGLLLPEEEWLEAANAVMAADGEKLTYFELVTVMAVYMIEKEKLRLAVMETGLGGSFDATTALEADLVVFTPMALDHCNVLGSSLAEIARDKAGALRPGRPAISAAQQAAAREELLAAAADKKSPVTFLRGHEMLPHDFGSGSAALGLSGAHQLENASLALAAWRNLAPLVDVKADDQLISSGLENAWLPGRMQFAAPAPHLRLPALILDGAHNSHGLSTLGRSLALQGTGPGAVIFSCLEDKEPEKMLPHLRVLSTGPIFVPQIQNHPRAMDAKKLASMIGFGAMPAPNISKALELAYKSLSDRLPEELDKRIAEKNAHPLLICGSLYLLGEFYALYPQYLSKEQA